MLHRSLTLSFFALAATLAGPAIAAIGEPVEDCIDLSQDRSLRHNGAQFLYVRDGAEHYRLSFRGGRCDPMTMTSKIALSTDATVNRVCPGTARLKARGESCLVTGIEKISAEDHARRLRRR